MTQSQLLTHRLRRFADDALNRNICIVQERPRDQYRGHTMVRLLESLQSAIVTAMKAFTAQQFHFETFTNHLSIRTYCGRVLPAKQFNKAS